MTTVSGYKRKRLTKRTRAPYPKRTKSVSSSYSVYSGTSLNEKKVIDVDPAAYAFDTTGSVTLLNGVATGTDFTDRIGRKIVIKSIYSRGIVFPVDNNVGNTLCRMLIVYDMQSNGSAPAITDVLKSASPASQLNMNNRDRFRVLVDKQWAMGVISDAATTSIAGSPTVFSHKTFKKCNLEVLFNGTTNGIGSIATGAIYRITIGNQIAGNGGTSLISSRIRFADA